jgi:hypothetical protein
MFLLVSLLPVSFGNSISKDRQEELKKVIRLVAAVGFAL